jgi:hypothetical protein
MAEFAEKLAVRKYRSMQMDASEGGLKSDLRKCFEGLCGVEELRN